MLLRDYRPIGVPRSEIGLDELRGEALLIFLLATFAVASYMMAFVSDSLRVETWLTPFGLLTLIALTFRIRKHLRKAGALLVAGLFLLVALEATIIRGDPLLYFLLAAPVGMATVILGTSGGAIAAAIASSIVLLTQWEGDPDVALSREELQLFLVWSTLLLVATLHRCLHTALDWSWNSFLHAQAKTEELQERQGELNRTLKSLNEAYDRLEGMNDELAYARRAAEGARRLKAEFAANVSHELRTPLNLVIGFTETMVMSPESYGGEPLPAPYRGDLDAVYRNAKHLSNLIDDILDLSQVEAGRMGLSKERVELEPIVEEAFQVVGGLFESKNLELRAEIQDGLPLAFVDRTRIRQVLINLLNNAARFTDQGSVVVQARLEDNALLVGVADTGVGIPAEELPRVFEEFHQIDGPVARRAGGSGLGLAICKHFVEMHGGSIWADSEPGRGSTFYFSLPLIDNVVTAFHSGEWMSWERVQRDGSPRQTMLALCDDPALVKTLQRYLEDYDVRPAASLEDARGLAAEGTVHGLVVVGGTEEESYARLQEIDGALGNVPVAICSVAGRRELQREIGAAAYLVKPVARADLARTIEELGDDVRSVLVVDDDPDIVQMLGRMLRSILPNPRIRNAYGGGEAMAILAEWQPDVILLDLLMPDVDGYRVAEWVQSDERLRGIPIVVITAKGLREEVLRAGFVGFSRPGGLSIGELTRHLALGFGGPRVPRDSDPAP